MLEAGVTGGTMPTLADLYANHVFEASLRIPPRLTPIGGAIKQMTLTLRASDAKVHPLLPKTSFWSYNGQVPGPTVIVNHNSKIRVIYRNRIATTLPFESVTGDPDTMNDTGSKPGAKDAHLNQLPAWCVTHLHGAPAHGDCDGWTNNMDQLGSDTEKSYTFATPVYETSAGRKIKGGRAATLWYHDHAMGVTRFNVYAGLAGMWLVRDPIEKTLRLPTGEDEVPLVIQDRNFETVGGAANGVLTGRLLHKINTDVMETFPPATLVNGTLWPKHRVRPRLGRLHIVNGSNARVYRLHFMGRKSVAGAYEKIDQKFVQQIGTDGGLLKNARDLTLVNGIANSNSLVLASGERADVLVDFGGLAATGYMFVDVYNSAPAPFDSAGDADVQADVTLPDAAGFRPFPAVMRFVIKAGAKLPRAIRGMALDPLYQNLKHADLPGPTPAEPHGHGHSLIVLREEDGKLFLHEMMEEGEANEKGMNMHKVMVPAPVSTDPDLHLGMRLTIKEQSGAGWKDVAYVTAAKKFDDMRTIFIPLNSWHLLKVLNLSPDTHPFHVHLVQFQCLKRQVFEMPMVSPAQDQFTFGVAPTDVALTDIEKGWKDTLRVNPGNRDAATAAVLTAEMYSIAAQFVSHAGQYMYHCHILEHEDQEMMRPFTVVPEELMAMMGHMHHGP
jgi:FtsP/CotA-like multicopper oxidase with cupredoxin domain